MCNTLSKFQIDSYANRFLKENYGLTLDVPLVINGRLKSTYGRFRYSTNRLSGQSKAVSVELNKTFVVSNSKDEVLNVLRHELIHYALFMLNKPFSDGDVYFENELKKHNTYSQMDINMKLVSLKSKYVKFYTYECDCGVSKTKKNITKGIYSCAVCKKGLAILGIEKKLV